MLQVLATQQFLIFYTCIINLSRVALGYVHTDTPQPLSATDIHHPQTLTTSTLPHTQCARKLPIFCKLSSSFFL